MLIEGQKIEMKWNAGNKKWYESRGYKFTKYNDIFLVNAEDLSRYSNAKVKINCDYCKREYETSYQSYMNGRKKIEKDACIHCGQKKSNEITKKDRAEKVFKKLYDICEDNGYTLLTNKNEFTSIHDMKIKIICPIHGYQEVNLKNFLNKKRCPQCGLDKRAAIHRSDPDYIEYVVNSVNNNILLNKTEYKNANTKNLKILCGECGEEIFVVSFQNYCQGVNRCKHCSSVESRGEFKIRKCLEDNDIKFEKEYWFPDCRDINPLPFDFYLPDYNVLIEFDGQQHYDTWFYRNMDGDPELRLAECQRRDSIKTNYCKNKNIPLLRIPYWEEKNIKNIILDYLGLYNNQCA